MLLRSPVAGALALALLSCSVWGVTQLTLLHMNDHHSFLLGDDHQMEIPRSLVDIKADESKDIHVNFGGFPRHVAAFKRLQTAAENSGRDVLKLHAGDVVTGTLFWTLFKGEANAKMMGQICFDAFELGNHEFDEGDEVLANFLDMLQAECSTPVLGANVVPGPSSPLNGKIQASVVRTLQSGARVGIVGIDIAGKTMNSSRPSPGTTLTDEREAAQREVDKLTADGVEIIVLLTHIGLDNDIAWLSSIEGVDVIVGGDSHTLLGNDGASAIFSPKGQYPQGILKDDGSLVCVVQAWEYSKAIGNLEVDFDDEGNVTRCGGNPVFAYSSAGMMSGGSREDPQPLDEEDTQTVLDYLTGLGAAFMEMPEDAEAQAELEKYENEIEPKKQEKIADVPVRMCYDRAPAYGRNNLCEVEATLPQGSEVVTWFTEAILAMEQTADVSLYNSGGVRTDIDAGDLTIFDVYKLEPFGNDLVTIEMKASDLLGMLETTVDSSSGSFPYLSGIRYDLDLTAGPGQKISNPELNRRLEGTWKALDLEETIVLTTNNYLAAKRDPNGWDFSAFKMKNTFKDVAEQLVNYARATGNVVAPPKRRFTIQAYTDKNGVRHGDGARAEDCQRIGKRTCSREPTCLQKKVGKAKCIEFFYGTYGACETMGKAMCKASFTRCTFKKKKGGCRSRGKKKN